MNKRQIEVVIKALYEFDLDNSECTPRDMKPVIDDQTKIKFECWIDGDKKHSSRTIDGKTVDYEEVVADMIHHAITEQLEQEELSRTHGNKKAA